MAESERGRSIMPAGRKYRIEFDFGQKLYAERVGGICRSVWNTALEQRRDYRRRGAWIGYEEQCKQLADAKGDFDWLAEAPSQVLQQALKDLDQACRRHGTWKVHWKSRSRWIPSFRFPTAKHIPVERINRKWGRVFLPKFGWARFRMSRRLGGRVKSATVSRDGEHWFVSFVVQDEVPLVAQHARPGQVAGVDRGVISAAVTSDGEFFDRRHAGEDGVSGMGPPALDRHDRAGDLGYLRPGEAERYLRLQRRLAQSSKGSAGRHRTARAMGKIMRRVRCRRADFNAQAAHRLTRDYGQVVLEELGAKGMTASAKGTLAEPGSRVAQKSGLNKAILDKGWYGLEVALRSKARSTGTTVITVNPAYTSQTCSVPTCGKVDAKSRESQALFVCTACGHREHADVNAAKSIKARGQAAGLVVSGRGDSGIPESVKRQAPRSIARSALPAPRAAA